MNEKSHIPKVNVGIPTEISTTPLPNMEEYQVPQPVPTPTVKVAKQTIFQRIINWLLKRNKDSILAYLLIGLRQVVYPFDVYKVDENGNWEIDEKEQAIKQVKWASHIAKLGSLATFALAYVFNEPVKDFTGKTVIEWLMLLLN